MTLSTPEEQQVKIRLSDIDTPERNQPYGTRAKQVLSDLVFREQRKLSFTYGAVFFIVTLAVPALTIAVEGWWKTTIWGGFTANYLFISLLYYVFLWTMAWTYSKRADALDDRLAAMADKITHDVAEAVSDTED